MIKVFFQASRITNLGIGIVCSLVTFLKVPNDNFLSFLIGTLIVFLLMVASNLTNDIYDIKSDKVNKPCRPLVKYPGLKKSFQILALLSFFASTLLSIFISQIIFLIVLFSVPVLFFYTPILKGVPLLGNIMVSFYLGFVFIFIEICVSGDVSVMILPALFAFGISLIREIIKDVEDYSGDKLAKIKTLPVYIGVKKTIYISCFFMILFLLFCGSLIFFKNNFYYNISVFFLVFMPIFYLIFFLVKDPTSKACFRASALLKKITILGLIIIYII